MTGTSFHGVSASVSFRARSREQMICAFFGSRKLRFQVLYGSNTTTATLVFSDTKVCIAFVLGIWQIPRVRFFSSVLFPPGGKEALHERVRARQHVFFGTARDNLTFEYEHQLVGNVKS